MANWLLDYIEMTEYIPSELREQLTSIRELDLQVHNAMDELEKDIKIFFSKVNSLSQQERQDQFDAFLKKCDVATKAASDKVKVADKLHDLVEKSMRLLDQGLEKLKEDLLEGDKAYIVEDLERRSQELDEQLKLEHETMLQRQQKLQGDPGEGSHSKGAHKNNNNNNLNANTNINNEINHSNHSRHLHSNNNNQQQHQSNHHHHRQSLPAQSSINCNHHPHHHNIHNINTNHRSRNNSTGTLNSVGSKKKRERKRLNSTMTIFNRNSRTTEDDSSLSNQTFLSSPLTPEYLTSLQNSNSSVSDVTGSNNGSLTTMKGMMAGNKNLTGINDKSNGNDHSARAKQPILTAIDAAHAVSPNATNSDKLVLFSSNANGDIYKSAAVFNTAPTTITTNTTTMPVSVTTLPPNNNDVNNKKQNLSSNHHLLNANQQHQTAYQNQLSSNLLSKVAGYHSGDSTLSNNPAISKNERHNLNHLDTNNQRLDVTPFSALPLSSRHDPIMVAASQAISATQNMTPGRRTSSLKASYAAVNSGRLHTAPNQQQLFNDQGGKIHEVYCKCRSHIQDSSMIACDNSKCKIEWFHYECVGITSAPEGEWYCDDCRVSKGIQKSGNNKQPKTEGVNVT